VLQNAASITLPERRYEAEVARILAQLDGAFECVSVLEGKLSPILSYPACQNATGAGAGTGPKAVAACALLETLNGVAERAALLRAKLEQLQSDVAL
jgi:hypothetical protein